MIHNATSADKRYTVMRADTVSDLESLLTAGTVPAVNAQRFEGLQAQWGNIRNGSSWGDIDSLEDARKLFSYGWDAGAERARTESASMPLADLTPEAFIMRRRRVYRDTGDSVRIESALAGDWSVAFEGREKRASRAPAALSVACAFGGAGGIDHDEMFWTGVQMVILTDILEAQGWRIELRAIKANDYGKTIHIQDITVKTADQSMREDAVMALFGHAGVYRVFGWAGNLMSSAKVPQALGTVLTGLELANAMAGASNRDMVAPASLVVPQAYSRYQAIENLKAALARVRDMATA